MCEPTDETRDRTNTESTGCRLTPEQVLDSVRATRLEDLAVDNDPGPVPRGDSKQNGSREAEAEGKGKGHRSCPQLRELRESGVRRRRGDGTDGKRWREGHDQAFPGRRPLLPPDQHNSTAKSNDLG